MKKTTHLELNKPELTDYVNVEDLNENVDIIDEAINENKERLATHLADEAKHLKAGERKKWNNEFSTYKVDKDDNSTFKTVEKRRVDGTLFATSVFSEPDTDGNYLTRTYIEYAADGVTAVKKIVYDLLYDDVGDWINEVLQQ